MVYNDIGRAHSQTHVLSGAGGYESRSFEALSPIIKAYRPIMTAASQPIPGVVGGTANNNPWRSAQQQRARESPAIKEVLYPSHRAASDFFLPRHVTSRSVQVLPPATCNTRRVYTRSYTTPAAGVHQQLPPKPPRRVTFDLPPTTPRGGASNGNDDELFASYQNSQAAGMTSVCEVAGVASWLRSRRQANNKESFRIKTVNNNNINSLSRRYSASSGVVVLPSSLQQSAVVYQQQGSNNNRRGVTSAFAAIDSSSYKLPPTVGPTAGNGAAVGPAAGQACSPAAVALLRACREGDEDILNDLIAGRVPHVHLQAADVNCVDVSGRTPASYVAASGSLSMLEALARFPSIDFNRADNEGNTPLHFAAQAGHVEVLNLLLSRCAGVEVDSRNNLGFTPLMKAALQGRTKCAKLLLFAGASPSMRDLGRGFRAEQWARYCGRHVCAEVIDKFSRHRLLERAAAAHTNSGRWGSEPELSSPPAPSVPQQQAQHHSGGGSWLRSKLRRAFRSNADAPSSKSRHEYSSSCPSSHSGTPPPQTPRVFIVPKVQVTPAPINSPTAADTSADTAAQDSSNKPTPNSRRKK